MALFEDDTHVFILRVWRERREVKDDVAEWRGHITYVPSGERRYIKDLDDVIAFISPYVEGMGVNPDPIWKLRHWLERYKRPFRGRG